MRRVESNDAMNVNHLDLLKFFFEKSFQWTDFGVYDE